MTSSVRLSEKGSFGNLQTIKSVRARMLLEVYKQHSSTQRVPLEIYNEKELEHSLYQRIPLGSKKISK